ncbi:hypothetical protein D5018_04205 [Parashewanella curva]|uniref:Uncharacterized protein n=1 Tax=Parashewanella curva TaxID=2338552 RepID=A0A3L8Q0S1_9GAMM|nr:hypothetical protein [Parashewanella curva]RLV61050.1 hypothetical protein D5018_04205 [Parashewanella curva]
MAVQVHSTKEHDDAYIEHLYYCNIFLKGIDKTHASIGFGGVTFCIKPCKESGSNHSRFTVFVARVKPDASSVATDTRLGIPLPD